MRIAATLAAALLAVAPGLPGAPASAVQDGPDGATHLGTTMIGSAPTAGTLANWPHRGPITSAFGPRWGGFHNGLDIAAPFFTPVYAAAAGVVTTVGRPYAASGDIAMVVGIAHRDNLATVYVHLDDRRPPVVSVGERVNAGQLIAFVGTTGWSTGPHTHFMTILNGRAVDPRGYLPP